MDLFIYRVIDDLKKYYFVVDVDEEHDDAGFAVLDEVNTSDWIDLS